MPSNIIVSVVDNDGNSLQNAAVTLTGNGSPQMLLTDANGQCTFANMAGGNYKLVVVHEGFNTTAMPVTHPDASGSNVRVILKVVEELASGARSKRLLQLLTVVQYVFLFLIAALFAVVLYKGVAGSNLNLGDINAARGMITFVVSVVTVAIALILVMSAAFLSGSKDLDKRFAFGKDVFTILVGVLGTVMGFYYGQTASANTQNNRSAEQQTIQISEAKLDPAPKINSEFTMTADITGGTAPYKYVITFDKPTAIKGTPMKEAESADGKISQKFTVGAEAANQPVNYEITVTDKNGVKATSKKVSFTPTP
ncbi:MAG TPA: carboxypeptidase-like regulatory domain-containing protein [Pyrinomonadaceae bacterium]|nr:carboxypeptidase-like regulatory domain-containing protein [Pyrinomonadaceae bacterium]